MVSPRGFVRPTAHYIRHVELTERELDELVEYDLDEQDAHWLEAYNKKYRKETQGEISMDTFELVMDRLEKEWFELTKDIPKHDPAQPLIVDDQPCTICMDAECDNTNAIVFCDGCNIAVHQECYGIPFIPEGQWLCRKCMVSPEHPVSCICCPNEGGAFKQTTNNKWCHLLCALWIPGMQIVNPVYMEPIEATESVDPKRWKLICSICKRASGACIQCDNRSCYTAFHVTCARAAQYSMVTKNSNDKNVMAVYCPEHEPKRGRARDDSSNSSWSPETIESQNSTPIDSPIVGSELSSQPTAAQGLNIAEAEMLMQGEYDSAASGAGGGSAAATIDGAPVYARDDEEDQMPRAIDSVRTIEAIEQAESEIDKAARAHSHHYLTRAPVIPLYIGQRIVDRLDSGIPARQRFVTHMCRYWALKREARRGAPLLKRLHLEPWTAYSSMLLESDKERAEKYAALTHLRADLERVRMLAALVRRRENRKLQAAQLSRRYFELVAFPLQLLMHEIIETLSKRDVHNVFAKPVSLEEVPDYLSVVKYPIDFETMTQKIDRGDYIEVQEFERDLLRVFDNAARYNRPDTYYYRLAKRLELYSRPLLASFRAQVARLGVQRVGDPIDRSIFDDILVRPEPTRAITQVETDEAVVPEHEPVSHSDVETELKEEGELDVPSGVEPSTVELDGQRKSRSETESIGISLVDSDISAATSNAGAIEIQHMEVDDAGLTTSQENEAPRPDAPMRRILRTRVRAVTPDPHLHKSLHHVLGPHAAKEATTTDAKITPVAPDDAPRRSSRRLREQSEQTQPPTITVGASPSSDRDRTAEATASRALRAAKRRRVSESATKPTSTATPTADIPATRPAASSRRAARTSKERRERSAARYRNVPHAVTAPVTGTRSSKRLRVQASTDAPKATDSSAMAAASPPREYTAPARRSSSRISAIPNKPVQTTPPPSAPARRPSSSRPAASGRSRSSDHIPYGGSHRTERRSAMPKTVWAKMPGFPWFPAEIVTPSSSVPKTVLNSRTAGNNTLVCFFESGQYIRTWQWLGSDSIKPLGRDDELDIRCLKLHRHDRKKAVFRRSVQQAYEAACAVAHINPQRLLSRL